MNTAVNQPMSNSFAEWQRLSDSYVICIDNLEHDKPGAAEEAMRVSRVLQNCAGAEDQKANSSHG